MQARRWTWTIVVAILVALMASAFVVSPARADEAPPPPDGAPLEAEGDVAETVADVISEPVADPEVVPGSEELSTILPIEQVAAGPALPEEDVPAVEEMAVEQLLPPCRQTLT